MRKVFFLLFSVISLSSFATDYYISATGNDAAGGISESTPWQTITKVNSVFASLKPGDRILFKCGDTFYGTLNISKSGLAGSPITIGSFGSGNKPVITGFTTVSTGWTDAGNGIFSKNISCESAPEMVLIDGVQKAMGRYPNNGWLFNNGHSGDVSINCPDLNSSILNWTGAEVVQRKASRLVIDRSIITNHTGYTLSYSVVEPGSPPASNWGYFIQNDIRTLDSFGEWYFNKSNSTFYMYFGSTNPTEYTVQVSSIDILINLVKYSDYITIENISFQGANKTAITNFINRYITIQNCDIDFSGSYALLGNNAIDWTLSNNKINYANDVGIMFNSGSPRPHINDNTIQNIGVIAGHGSSSYISGTGICQIKGDNPVIEYNKITNSGYCGMIFGGNNAVVRNNLIENYCSLKDDGAGIYYGYQATCSNMIITDNIVLNGPGAPGGKPVEIDQWIAGIYLDYYSTNGITIKNNTVANTAKWGILISGSQNVTIMNNTVFSSKNCIMFQELPGLGSPIRNITMTGNIYFAKGKIEVPMFLTSTNNDFNLFGNFNNNFYARPVDKEKPILPTINWSGTNKTLPEWQILYNQDINSNISPITITDTSGIDFYYNATKSDKIIKLVQPMLDVKGTSYINSVTLAPFTSIVLMVDPNPPVPVVPVYVSSVINNLTPTKVDITYTVTLDANSVPLPSDFIVKVNGTVRTVTSITISGTRVILTLASPVIFGDIVTISYTQNPGRPLQTPTLGAAANLIDVPVKNNLVDPSIANEAPKVFVDYEEYVFSGFVYELDASGTTDANNDDLTFTWTTPLNIPVSGVTGSKIRYLTPLVSAPQTLSFGLTVSDGKAETSSTLTVSNSPYKPELGLGNVRIIEASNYYQSDYPGNVDDGSLNTKWSVNGDNQWITISLAEPLKINHVQIALLPGQKYESHFDLFASRDNVLWEPVLQNMKSCGFSGNPQNYEFPADKTGNDYYFVKLLGHGSALDTWNNYSEIRLFGSPGSTSRGSDEQKNIAIYPNPARDIINLLVLEPTSELQTLRIFDMTGKIRFETSIDPGTYNVQIPLTLSPGAYIVQVLLGKLIRFAQTLVIAR